MFTQKDDQLSPGQQPDVAVQSKLEGVFADQPIAKRVECMDGRIRLAVWHEDINARLHLLGGVVRERQRKDLARQRASSGDQPGDASGNDLRLACARTGQYERGARAMSYCPTLFAVGAHQELRAARLGDSKTRISRDMICIDECFSEDHAPNLSAARASLYGTVEKVSPLLLQTPAPA